MQVTLSIRKGAGYIRHNNREFIPKNVDRELIKDNVTYKQQDIIEAYQTCFGKADRKSVV